jgi:hypothetical protein
MTTQPEERDDWRIQDKILSINMFKHWIRKETKSTFHKQQQIQIQKYTDKENSFLANTFMLIFTGNKEKHGSEGEACKIHWYSCLWYKTDILGNIILIAASK